MKTAAVVMIVFLFLFQLAQLSSRIDEEHALKSESNQRLKDWNNYKQITPFEYDIKIEKPMMFCRSESEKSEIIRFYPNGRFEFKTSADIDTLNSTSKNVSGTFSIKKGQIYFAWPERYNSGAILTVDSNGEPKTVVFSRKLFEFNKCTDFIL